MQRLGHAREQRNSVYEGSEKVQSTKGKKTAIYKNQEGHVQVCVDRRLEQQPGHSEHERPECEDAPHDQQHVLQRVPASDAERLVAALELQRLIAVHHVDLGEGRRPERASIFGPAGRDDLRDWVLALVELGHLLLGVGVDVCLRDGHGDLVRLGFLGHGAGCVVGGVGPPDDVCVCVGRRVGCVCALLGRVVAVPFEEVRAQKEAV